MVTGTVQVVECSPKFWIDGFPDDWATTPVFATNISNSTGSKLAARGALPVPDAGITGPAILILNLKEVTPLEELVYVVDRLLGPGGCPWDREQTHESLKKYLLEEAYEVLDAIDAHDMGALREELGDLLLQPVLHAQMEKAAGSWDIEAVAAEITAKLIRRHPHVFGDLNVADSDQVLRNWDAIKQTEKGDAPRSLLAGVPKGMASLLRAFEVSKRAARAGFEWPNIDAVFEKLDEERAELVEAIESGDHSAIESELGDVFFTVVNIARWLKVEPEEALRRMLNRFTTRFMTMESLTETPLIELSAEEWESLWQAAKKQVG